MIFNNIFLILSKRTRLLRNENTYNYAHTCMYTKSGHPRSVFMSSRLRGRRWLFRVVAIPKYPSSPLYYNWQSILIRFHDIRRLIHSRLCLAYESFDVIESDHTVALPSLFFTDTSNTRWRCERGIIKLCQHLIRWKCQIGQLHNVPWHRCL